MDGAVSGTTETRAGAPDADSPAREWGWVLRVLAVVVVFAVIAVARSRQVDIPFRDPHGKLFTDKIRAPPRRWCCSSLIDIVVRWFRGRRQGRPLWPTARTRWTPYRIGDDRWRALVAYQVVYLCYRNLKSWDVFRSPQDDMLLRWDRWLFFGHSPAVLLHDLLGEDLAARLLTDLYESFS